METRRLLTVEQAAEELQVHPQTVRNMVREKRIKAWRINARLIRIRAEDLEELIQEES